MLEHSNIKTSEQKKRSYMLYTSTIMLSAPNHPSINLVHTDPVKAEEAEKEIKKTVMMIEHHYCLLLHLVQMMS